MSFYHDFDEEKKVLEHRIRLYDNPVNDFYKLNVICFLSTYNSKYLNEEIINLLYIHNGKIQTIFSTSSLVVACSAFLSSLNFKNLGNRKANPEAAV